MANFHIRNGAHTNPLIMHLDEIGEVSRVDLLPRPHQRIIVRGTEGTITLDTDGASFYGSGSGGAEQVAAIFRALGWRPYANHRVFRRFDLNRAYRLTRDELLDLNAAVPAGDLNQHFRLSDDP